MVVEVPRGSGRRFVDIPIRLRDSDKPAGQAAPRLGEHTVSILAELGLNEHQVAKLQAEGVV